MPCLRFTKKFHGQSRWKVCWPGLVGMSSFQLLGGRVVTFLVAVDVQKVQLFVWEPHVGVDKQL